MALCGSRRGRAGGLYMWTNGYAVRASVRLHARLHVCLRNCSCMSGILPTIEVLYSAELVTRREHTGTSASSWRAHLAARHPKLCSLKTVGLLAAIRSAQCAAGGFHGAERTRKG